MFQMAFVARRLLRVCLFRLQSFSYIYGLYDETVHYPNFVLPDVIPLRHIDQVLI